MTAIMLKHGEAIIKEHYRFFTELFDLLPTPKWSTVAGKEKGFGFIDPLTLTKHDAGCECCTDEGYTNKIAAIYKHLSETGTLYPVTKDQGEYNASAIESIDDEFRRNVGAKTAKKVDDLERQWLLRVAGKNKNPGISAKEINDTDFELKAVDFSAPLFKILLFDTIIQAMVEADLSASSNYRDQPEEWREQNPKPNPGPPFFDPRKDYIKEIYQRGYTECTAKITKEYLPLIKELINTDLRNQVPWNNIAYNLARQIGEGKVWHWSRLVRSEMTRGIAETKRQRYKEQGVDYVKYSATYKRCPICDGYASYNDGYYKRSSSPMPGADTHPNCTCDIIAIYNLPSGVNLDALGDTVFIN
jgi:hypothetical protein